MNKLVVICHGILSKPENMGPLSRSLADPQVKTHVHSYAWRTDSVLASGIKLASTVGDLVDEPGAPSDVVLVGHSQGGLVCRVAAAALHDPNGLEAGIKHVKFVGGPAYREPALGALQKLKAVQPGGVAVNLLGVAMLGTPNSGAMTFGQLSMLGRAASGAMAWLGDRTGHARNIAELTTDRLFRVLQRARVENVRYLSISGSSLNRFSRASWTDVADLPVVGRFGINLNLPNDGVVEDESVDLRQSVLPTEIADLDTDYDHIRLFRDCTDVGHSKLHETPEVVQCLRDWMGRL